MEIKNSNILITGGSSGIGKETAKQFVSKGATVVITGRDENKLNQVAQEIGAIPLLFDVSNLDSIPKMTAKAISLLSGKIDVLVNNAGIGVFPKLGEITIEDLQNVYTTNVFGLAILSQEVVKTFKAQNYGNIINIGSSASLKGFAGGSIYAASKFAVRAMTQSWQAELRPFNIRVAQVNPSEVASAFAAPNREEREEVHNKLGPTDIAHSILAVVEMRDKGFIPEVNIWATNPVLIKPIFKIMKLYPIFIICISLVIGACNSENKQHEKHAHRDHNKSNKHMHKNSFEDLTKRFESKERARWQKPELVIDQLGDIKGKKIADIGAGTGYFAFRLANLEAKVTAIDVDQRFIKFIDDKIAQESTKNLSSKLVGYDNPDLGTNAFDIVLIVDTYHHFDDKTAYLKHCFNGLKEGGVLMNVDFKHKETNHGPPLDHRIKAEDVKKDLISAGFTDIEIDQTTLTEQYIITAKKKVQK